jgi:hypothetical protein
MLVPNPFPPLLKILLAVLIIMWIYFFVNIVVLVVQVSHH